MVAVYDLCYSESSYGRIAANKTRTIGTCSVKVEKLVSLKVHGSRGKGDTKNYLVKSWLNKYFARKASNYSFLYSISVTKLTVSLIISLFSDGVIGT